MSDITILDLLMSLTILMSFPLFFLVKKTKRSSLERKNQIERLRLTERYSKDLFVDESKEDEIKKIDKAS
jgi:hypothetical protein